MEIIPYLLLLFTTLLEAGKNTFSNEFSKRILKNETDNHKFNFLLYAASFAILVCFPDRNYTVFSVTLGIIFAISLWLNQYFFLKALETGPMSFVSFIQGLGLLVPLAYGIFAWGEPLGIHHVLLLGILVLSMALSLGIKNENAERKWILYATLAMLGLGAIGILQGVHQMSVHKAEVLPFLRAAFFVAMLLNLISWRFCERKQPASYSVKSRALPLAAVSGAGMGLVHVINLYLAGILPKIIFFPMSNGGLIFLTILAARLFFREQCTMKQWAGIVIGILALSVIGL